MKHASVLLLELVAVCTLGLPLLLSLSKGLGQEQQGQPKFASAIPSDFKYNKVVVIVAFERFQYFRQCANALRSAKGSNKYVVMIYIDGEPGDPYAFDMVGRQDILSYSFQLRELALRGVGFREVIVSEAPTNLGVWANKKRAVQGGFELSDFVIVLEEDIVLAQDGLHWFEWHVESGFIFKRPEVAVATCYAVTFPYNRRAKVDAYDILGVSLLGLAQKFYIHSLHHPWGWATWRRSWDVVKDDWTGQDKVLLNLIRNNSWFESQPMVARCNNIGATGANKRGLTVGSIHQRQVTSSEFSTTFCDFQEIKRANLSRKIDLDIREVFQFVRFGSQETEFNMTLTKLANKIASWKSHQSDPSFWESSC